MKTSRHICLIACGACLLAPTASHAAIVLASGVTSSTIPSNGTVLGNIISTTTGSGNGFLSAPLDESNKLAVVTGTSYSFNASGQYLTDNANGGTFTFSFTGGATIGEILVWNYSQNSLRGLDSISNVEYSTDNGANYTSLLTNFGLADAQTAGFKAQAIDFGNSIAGVTQIRLTVAQGSTGGAESAGGFDQVAFSSVPEPSTALLGMLGAAFLFRRHRTA